MPATCIEEMKQLKELHYSEISTLSATQPFGNAITLVDRYKPIIASSVSSLPP